LPNGGIPVLPVLPKEKEAEPPGLGGGACALNGLPIERNLLPAPVARPEKETAVGTRIRMMVIRRF
jgi:hypothetical protein